MSFATPAALLLLAAVPLLVALLVRRARRRDRFAMRFPAAGTLAEAATAEGPWWRWAPSALALAAFAALALAAAHPQRATRVALQKASIMLVTDHSGSMAATDVAPSRLGAAKAAARTFVDRLPGAVRLGIVAYSAAPDDVQGPSTDHDTTRRTIERQVANGGTATGDALATALGLLRPSARTRTPAAVVLLSDGATTVGSDPEVVAAQARRLRVPIYTVALGNADATVPNPDPFGPPLPAIPDPRTLRRVAQISGARAFSAQDAGQLGAIYRTLGSRLGSRTVTRNVTAVPVVAGLVLLLGAGGLVLTRRTL